MVTPLGELVTYQWRANDLPIPGATSETLKITKDFIGQVLSVIVTDEEGNTAESEDTAPVVSDKSYTFELVDDQGFQADGTALTTDTLRVSYGSELGTPRHVTWYNDGAVMAVYTLDANSLTQEAFNSDLCRSKKPLVNAAGVTIYQELATGNWKVTIENTSGELWTSNEVTVVYDEKAVMTDVSIEDDYDSKDNNGNSVVAIAEKTGTAILNVTFNKDYKGTLYLVNSKYEKGYDTTASEKGKNLINLRAGVKAALDALAGGDASVKTLTGLTNKKATTNKAAYYEDEEGAIHVKLPVALATTETVTRGESYYLIWDQDDIDGDEVKNTSKKEALNTSDDMLVPFVVGPASVTVTKYQNPTTKPEVTLYDETGAVLEWWTQNKQKATGDAIAGFDSVKLFGVDSNSKSSSDTAISLDATGTQVIDKGVVSLTSNNIAKKYVYVTMKTTKGIFAEKSATLTSEISETAIDALDSMSMKEDSKNPADAIVEFKGLSSKAPGTVYIVNKIADVTAGTIAAIDLETDSLGKATVAGGATSVTISDVFSDKQISKANYENPSNPGNAYTDTDNEEKFAAVFIPDDQELWKPYWNGKYAADGVTEQVFVLEPTITSFDKTNITYKLNGTTAGTDATATAAAVPTKAEIEIGGIQLLDQFGNKYARFAKSATDTENAVAGSATAVVSTNVESASGTSSVNHKTGIVTVTVSMGTLTAGGAATGAFFDKGESFTYKMAGLKDLTVTVKTSDRLAASANTLIIGSANATTIPTASGTTNVVGQNATNTATAAGGDKKLSDAISVS